MTDKPDKNRRQAPAGAGDGAPADGRRAKEKQKKKRRERALLVLNVLCAVSGGFFLAVYLPYFVFHVTKGHPADVAASLLVFAGVLIPFLLRKPLKKLLKKLYTPLKIFWCFVMCVYMVTFSVFAVSVTKHDDVPVREAGKKEVVVVFGCQIHSENWLSLELEARLKKAAEVLLERPDALCVVSGGKGRDEPVSEAYAMKKYLSEKCGIGEARILMEDRSSDTAENVAFSLELLKNEGIDPQNCTFLCVSSEFHTPRIHLLFRMNGVEDAATVSAETPLRFNLFVYTVREYMSYVHLWLFGS
ncbi:MAG: YdcF family protein [Clostridia bacterium]|nr:YdcF family protein [Clostridia bacterium]